MLPLYSSELAVWDKEDGIIKVCVCVCVCLGQSVCVCVCVSGTKKMVSKC
jgi:hypothetical protein